MRLSDLLSKPPATVFSQVDGFLVGKKCNIGQQISLNIGQIALNFFVKTAKILGHFILKAQLCVSVPVILLLA